MYCTELDFFTLTFSFTVLNQMEKSSYHSSEEKAFAEEHSAEIVSLSDFVNKDSKEIEDLETGTTAHSISSKKMTARKGTRSTTSKSKSSPKKDVIVEI